MTGGTAPTRNDQTAASRPEIYRPDFNRATSSYGPETGQWHLVDEPASRLRNYHSTALLMPNGRVWTAGGNSPTQSGQPDGAAQKSIDIF